MLCLGARIGRFLPPKTEVLVRNKQGFDLQVKVGLGRIQVMAF
jgi:hypothetical protein